MAEILVNLLAKLAESDLHNDMLSAYGVGHVMEKIQHELSWIKFFMWDTDTIGDESREIWESKVKEVVGQLNGWTETFISEYKNAQEIQSIRQICSGKMEWMFRKLKKLQFSVGLRDQIYQIQRTVQSISQEIKKIKRSGMSIPPKGIRSTVQSISRPFILPDFDDVNVFGFEGHKAIIIGQLLDEDTTRRSVISIVGQGGLGKTTLANLVYSSDNVKRHFDLRVWLSISQEFELINLLRKILFQIYPDVRGKEEVDFISELSQVLSGRRYLIVLDDVWTDNLWNQIVRALPDNNNGSRILMTSRSKDVARKADPLSLIYKLSYLDHESSRELFISRALHYEIPLDVLPSDLLEIGYEIVRKCGGLPLALNVISGVLAKKEPTYNTWMRVLRALYHRESESNIISIMGLSYDQLPINLKLCFMYFALFPEDYVIKAKPLIRMWIAEGLIPCKENEMWEDTAKSFLEDLVSRSMVQVSRRSQDGSILACRLHDLMHDLAIQKAEESNFLVSWSNTYVRQISADARRLAIHNSGGDEVMIQVNPNLRSLFLVNSPIPNLSRHKLLKVLTSFSGNTDMEVNFEVNFENLEALPYIRYFELSGRRISANSKKKFKNLLASMKMLQTLDLQRAPGFGDLPDSVWRVKTLRHIMLPPYTSGPPSSADLSNLQTLTGVKTEASWDTSEFPNLPGILDLDILIDEDFPMGVFISLLSTLEHLLSLKIAGTDILTIIADCRECSVYTHLQSLSLESRSTTSCSSVLDASMFPSQITELELANLQLQEDPMPVLKELITLKVLILGDKTYMSQTITCSAGSFDQLEELSFVGLEVLEKWVIEEGAMRNLKRLRIEHCPQLQVPLELKHLANLKEVY